VEHSRNLSEFCVDAKKFKYKVISKMKTRTMESVYISGYVSFGIGVLLLIGLIIFTWIALRKFQ
jgi:hypothetical protein